MSEDITEPCLCLGSSVYWINPVDDFQIHAAKELPSYATDNGSGLQRFCLVMLTEEIADNSRRSC
jgi:hypothetical protein